MGKTFPRQIVVAVGDEEEEEGGKEDNGTPQKQVLSLRQTISPIKTINCIFKAAPLPPAPPTPQAGAPPPQRGEGGGGEGGIHRTEQGEAVG